MSAYFLESFGQILVKLHSPHMLDEMGYKQQKANNNNNKSQ